MKFGVVTFPGSNCDQDMIDVLTEQLGQTVVNLWHKDSSIQNVDFVILPGGFSYGDYLRSGAIARFSPIMNEVVNHAKRGGYVMGICNGFQILTETGLVEGALLHNTNQRFICKNVYLKPSSKSSALTKNLSGVSYKIPIAHGEGRFYADEPILKKLEDNDQILFRYCEEGGAVTENANPNGSLNNIAGITNQSKNVFGMMPHPERAASSVLSNQDGLVLFQSLLHNC
ncbi:MAG: phosphoribosylformylglycinamidine synthase I [Bacteroidetes bacterium]|nr:phosphoribosylformylglycinamidine synthase I [Bacteroidota bacterium]